jgi:hypothetical protein
LKKNYDNNIFQEKTKMRALWSKSLFSVFLPFYFEQTENGHFKNVQKRFAKKLLPKIEKKIFIENLFL